jgi:hypothetical protein
MRHFGATKKICRYPCSRIRTKKFEKDNMMIGSADTKATSQKKLKDDLMIRSINTYF